MYKQLRLLFLIFYVLPISGMIVEDSDPSDQLDSEGSVRGIELSVLAKVLPKTTVGLRQSNDAGLERTVERLTLKSSNEESFLGSEGFSPPISAWTSSPRTGSFRGLSEGDYTHLLTEQVKLLRQQHELFEDILICGVNQDRHLKQIIKHLIKLRGKKVKKKKTKRKMVRRRGISFSRTDTSSLSSKSSDMKNEESDGEK